MAPIRAVIERAIIRRILEDIYGGSWGVLIIKNPELISTSVHWTIPDHRNKDGSPAFCLYVVGEAQWQYNVFKTGDVDTENRLTVEQVVQHIREKLPPERLTVSEFDRRIVDSISLKRRRFAPSTATILTGTVDP
ncbi:hypothetical protein DdX_03901 [Ditylenchus destructor]|uniref:Uncharacterized protein n=1 Tax=Ditylenchus destructor TaxID=166010 RepID=A0AAD4RBN4_9BILA|nr:hypothetical protein DdX_03901 [Ditylenchus destructor]